MLAVLDQIFGGPPLFTRLPPVEGSDKIVYETSGWAALIVLAALLLAAALGAVIFGPLTRLLAAGLPSVAIREHGGWDSRLASAASSTAGKVLLTGVVTALLALTGMSFK